MFDLSGLFKIVMRRRKHLQRAAQALKWEGWGGIRTFVAVFALLIPVQFCLDTAEQGNHSNEFDQDRFVSAMEQIGAVLSEMQKEQQKYAPRHLEYQSSSCEPPWRPSLTSSPTAASKSACEATGSYWLARLNGLIEKKLPNVVSAPPLDIEIFRNSKAAEDSQIKGGYCVGDARVPSDLSPGQVKLPEFLQQLLGRGRGD